METKLYRIKPIFARSKNIPVYFAAIKLRETERAVYLYGQGTTETTKMGQCCNCGRTLTHPVSVELGIGPECGKHYWNWDLIGGYTKENLERLKSALRSIKVDTWIPKSCVIEVLETSDIISPPKDNPQPTEMKKPAKQATQITFQQSGEAGIKIEFPFDISIVEGVKTIPGRRYHGNEKPKYWTAPRSIEAIEKLQEMGFEICDALAQYLECSKISVDDMDPDKSDFGHYQDLLFPFQKKGVAFLQAKNGRALIADEMGLGKTVQALAWLDLNKAKRPAVIVVPASLKLNWAREANRWMQDPKIQILEGKKANTPIIGDLIIINYDILPDWLEVLTKIKPQALVLDEVHYIKSNKTKRTKAVRQLAKGIPHVIALSGTPIVNRPIEILNAIRLIDKEVIPNPWQFLHRYCGAKHNGFGWDFTGATNTDELHEKLVNSIMIRRLKKDVLKDLPDKIRSHTPIQLDNEKEYYKAERNFIQFIREQKGSAAAERASGAAALAEIEGLKQLAVKGKLNQAIEWIRDFIEVDGKLVVFATHKFVIERLMKEFEGLAVKVDGSVKGPARDHAVQDFQNDPKVKLFVGNIKAAGVGLTLTASSNVAFLELPWTPGDLTQAEDRVHRIGQQDSVNIHYLLADGTIEERIANLIDHKRLVLDSVLDGQETDEQSLLSQLMDQYNQTEE